MSQHKIFATTLALSAFSIWNATAGDLGFRFKNGKCVNPQGQEGLNPSFIGACGDLSGTSLGRLNLNDTDFSGARFLSSDLQKTTFHRSNLSGVDFSGANLSGVEFMEAVLTGTNFTGAILKNVSFAEAKIAGATFAETDLRGSTLSFLDAKNTSFKKANLSGVALDSATLQGSDFSDAKFLASNLKDVNFSNANLSGADFKGATLVKNDLTKANLNRSNLVNAAIRDSIVNGATFKEARINKRSSLPFTAEQAAQLGIVIDPRADSFAEFNKHLYFKVRMETNLTDPNMLTACKAEGLEVACNAKNNGEFSDEKCADVGLVDGGNPMQSLSRAICNNQDPPQCPALNEVFQYMGGKFMGGAGCGALNGNWCADGNATKSGFALCVDPQAI